MGKDKLGLNVMWGSPPQPSIWGTSSVYPDQYISIKSDAIEGRINLYLNGRGEVRHVVYSSTSPLIISEKVMSLDYVLSNKFYMGVIKPRLVPQHRLAPGIKVKKSISGEPWFK